MVHEVPAESVLMFLLRSATLARRLANEFQPTVVVGGSGLMGPAVRMAARRVGAIATVYVHGLDLVTAHVVYRAFWLPALRGVDVAIANSRNTADIAARLGVARRNVRVVHPGTAIPRLDLTSGARFRAEHGLVGMSLLLSVGRNTRRKGLVEFIAEVLPKIVAQYPEAVLAVVGDDAPNSLHGSARRTSRDLREAAEKAGMTVHVKLLGPCDDATLACAYQAADVLVFPVRQTPGDVEGFGMVAIEAAAHGLPTVAYAVGGVPDAVESEVSGYLVPPNDPVAFADAVCRVLDQAPGHPMSIGCRAFAMRFTWSRFASDLLAVLESTRKSEPTRREGHAVLDLASRSTKAQKIEQLLGLRSAGTFITMLEIGCGSGGIASYFANHATLRCEVHAVDLQDQRLIKSGYGFQLVDGVELPFLGHSFDVVITNHVIEHVGEREVQLGHLREIHRVLRPNGVAYLAVPNRWQLVEPHYRLAFLSWLPKPLRTPYLRIRGRGQVYDCAPLSVPEVERLLREAGFAFVHEHRSAVLATFEIERPESPLYRYALRRLPLFVFRMLRRAIPTLIYTLRPL